MWTALAGIVSTIFGGLFGMKKDQASVIKEALDVLESVNSSNAQREQAIAQIISAEANGSGITSKWRPLTAIILLTLIVCSFFGLVPSHLNADMSPMMKEIFELFKICLMGYIPARTIDKIVSQLQIGKILKTYIEKKVL